MGNYWKLWEIMGNYGKLWEILGNYGKLYGKLWKYGNFQDDGGLGKQYFVLGVKKITWEILHDKSK